VPQSPSWIPIPSGNSFILSNYSNWAKWFSTVTNHVRRSPNDSRSLSQEEISKLDQLSEDASIIMNNSEEGQPTSESSGLNVNDRPGGGRRYPLSGTLSAAVQESGEEEDILSNLSGSGNLTNNFVTNYNSLGSDTVSSTTVVNGNSTSYINRTTTPTQNRTAFGAPARQLGSQNNFMLSSYSRYHTSSELENTRSPMQLEHLA